MAQEHTTQFTYEPLQPGFIRLLRILPESTTKDIRCYLHKLKTAEEERFAALSYCWGNPTPVAAITINTRPLGAARNLLDFLQTRFLQNTWLSRKMSDAFNDLDLWVDALCINQIDDEEKSEQVSRIWQIYSTATFTFAWLGKEKEFERRAFISLKTRS
jgi:hypothetical protein